MTLDFEKLLLTGLPLFFAALWLGIQYLCAWLGRWTRLARNFADQGSHAEQPIQQRRRFQSGSFGLMNYNSCLNIDIYEAGVRLAVIWPFRPGHPPLFIPWAEMCEPHVKRVFPFVMRLEVKIGTPPVKVLLPAWVGEEMAERSRLVSE